MKRITIIIWNETLVCVYGIMHSGRMILLHRKSATYGLYEVLEALIADWQQEAGRGNIECEILRMAPVESTVIPDGIWVSTLAFFRTLFRLPFRSRSDAEGQEERVFDLALRHDK
jgi:hypothetical protein